MKTHFASAERIEKSEIFTQNQELISIAFINEIASATNNMFLILNEQRQIVFANNTFLRILGIYEDDVIMGKRFGEALNCKNSTIMSGGCGVSEFCAKCGAVNAIMEALKGEESEKECRITTINNDALDFLIKTKPFNFENTKYVFVSAIDISDVKRREVLERVFFHDIMNTAGGLYGLAELIKYENVDNNPYAETIYNLSDKLIKEIEAQRILINAESGNLKINIEEVNLLSYLTMIKKMIENNNAVKHTIIEIKNTVENLCVSTDVILLQRVLINMIKNAAEASKPGEIITLEFKIDEDWFQISVHNLKYIPKDVQLQIFQRSFSTKGIGRGIGTYSMKLFGEKYLKGEVNYTTDIEKGTTFYIKIPQNYYTQDKTLL